MSDLIDVLRNVNVVAFCVLGLACVHQWRTRGEASTGWATTAFGALAATGVISLFLRTSPATPFAGWSVKVVLVVLVLFPYILYRSATAFQAPNRLVSITAHVSTVVVVLASLAVPHLPRPGTPQPGWWLAYRIVILAQWTILFSIVAVRLWGSARHEVTVVRRRMRTLALACAGLNGAVLLSGVGTSARSESVVVTTQALSLASALLFVVGLAPPAWLLQLWRAPEQLAFQAAMGSLFRAETQSEISAVLLPRAVGLVGARGAALVAPTGEVVASHGSIDAELRELRVDRSPLSGPVPGVQRVELRAGTLLLWTSHYAPYFGAQEFAVAESLGVFADIVMERCALVDQRRQAEAALTHQATHDALTGLPNRTLLEDRVTQALARTRRTESEAAVLFIDVDRFKVINDSLGHAAGDQLLRALARRLQGIVRPDDTIARFGGDEFVIVTEGWATDDPPTLLADRIVTSLAAPLCIDGVDIVATASIGVAVATPGHDAGSLLSDADAAMYQAKEQGRNRWVVFDSAMREAADQRLETENALRQALDHGELRVHYQPMVEIVSGRLVAVEALVRWEKDEDTLVLPRDFIPVAEETGLIIQLGATVLKEACRQVAEWQRDLPGVERLALTVNLSARELLSPGIVDQVREAVTSAGLEPSLLCLEITESVLLDDTQSCARSLQALHALGVGLAVDDFGTGYSSFVYLKRLSVDTLKIDRSFVAELRFGTSTRDRAIVAGIVDLAHAFGLTTVAEGVETAEQVAQLGALGCRLAQGYYFGRPMPPAEVGRWVRARQALSETTATATATATGAGPAGRVRVLVVDDQGPMRDLLRWTMEDDPRFRVVDVAADGREAVALARHHQPDLVLLDLAMPGVGGLEALPLIRAVAPQARVVVLSGLDEADLADKAREEGAAGYLVKGADPSRLLTDLHRLLADDGCLQVAAAGRRTGRHRQADVWT